MTAGPGRFGQPDLPGRPPPAGLFTRGYDRAGTDELVAGLLAQLQERSARLSTVERENRRLRAERDAEQHAVRVTEVQDSIGVLSTAQENADQVMADADAYRQRVAAESDRTREEARRAAEAILADAHDRLLDVDRREQEAQLTQDELQRQTDYLRSVRDTASTQVIGFLNGLVDHVAEEFGAADPAAVPGGTAERPPSAALRSDRPSSAFPQLLPVGVVAAGGRHRPPPVQPRPRVRREPRGHVRHLAGR